MVAFEAKEAGFDSKAAVRNESVPVIYKIDPYANRVQTKCIGAVTMQEVLDHFRTLEQDPNCPDFLDVFLDLSEVDSLPDTVQLSGVVSEVKRIQGRVRFGACAILVNRDAVFGMMRVFEVMGEQCFRRMRTFRVASEAEAWLASQQSLAEENENGTESSRR